MSPDSPPGAPPGARPGSRSGAQSWAEPGTAAGSELGALSDEELVERARDRNLASFEELAGRHEERLYRVAMRLLRNENDAREVLQDALLSAWQNLDSFAGRAQFGTWIYRVTVNGALMLLRSRRRRPTVSVEELAPAALDDAVDESLRDTGSDWSKRPDEQLQSGELKSHIEEALDQLPEILRLVFLLRDVEGLSTEETAEMLNVTVPTVKTRLHRARLALRQAITAYFEKN
jgi:RNA polymerase sigma-70 factor, ECF subfamily